MMFFRNLWRAFLRAAFNLFYNPFAFTYDPVSALVSRGHWRAWTRVAIPHIVGTRVLEIPCGTGNLLLDMCAAGYAPIGVDLSSAMLKISRSKKRAGHSARQAFQKTAPGIDPASLPCHPDLANTSPLLRARAQALPFASAAFDSIVMTFPPGFAYDPKALAEFYRLLSANGRLIWVDGGRLLPGTFWNRTVQNAVDLIEGAPSFLDAASEMLRRARFEARAEIVRDEASVVSVVIATKRDKQ